MSSLGSSALRTMTDYVLFHIIRHVGANVAGIRAEYGIRARRADWSPPGPREARPDGRLRITVLNYGDSALCYSLGVRLSALSPQYGVTISGEISHAGPQQLPSE